VIVRQEVFDVELEVLKRILVEVLNVDGSEIHPETTFVKDLGADSLDVFQIVVRLEEEFSVTFNQDEIERIETVEQALRLIQKKLDKK
jgi:acyl carrier protein